MMGDTSQSDSVVPYPLEFLTAQEIEGYTYPSPVSSESIKATSSASSSTPRVKRKRICLSLKQKLDILDRLDKGEKGSHIAREYNVGSSSIGDIKMNKDAILKFASSLTNEDTIHRRKTMRNPNNKKLDDAVYEWIQEMRNKGIQVTGSQICEKALELNKIEGSLDFKASSGWLKNFKSRHGLDMGNINSSLSLALQDPILSAISTINGDQNASDADKLEAKAYKKPTLTPKTSLINDDLSDNDAEQLEPKPKLPKRKRVCLSLKQKIDIIKKLKEGVTASDLAREYNIGTSTAADIKYRQSSILKFVSCFESMAGMSRRKTMRAGINKELDEAVYKWYQETVYSGKSLTGPQICKKALKLNKKIKGSSDFKASNGWLKNFKSRHGLELKVTDCSLENQLEAPNSPEDWTLNNNENEDVSMKNDTSITLSMKKEVMDPENSTDVPVDFNKLLDSFNYVIQWAENLNENCLDLENLALLREKAMSLAFSSADPVDREIDTSTLDKRDESISIDDMYEIERCVDWINENTFSKIALQFPDNLLGDAATVALKLEDMTSKEIFILGDTSYGSCCVDEVAAEHVSADGIIHFGHACLSLTKKVPVLYIFGKHVIDVENAVDSFQGMFQDRKSCAIIFYEVMYSHAIGAFMEQLSDYENLLLTELEVPGVDTKPFVNETNTCWVTKNHRHFSVPKSKSLRDYSVFYIGTRCVTITNAMFSLPECKFYSYNPTKREAKPETLDVNKHLKRRYYYIEKAKDAKIIGILVGTLGVSDNLTTINHLKELIKKAGKKSYTLVVGKLNNTKLANFIEIDIYVNIACIESSLVDSKEFYQPIITPYELEISLNQARNWTGDYIIDFSELLPGAVHYVPFGSNVEESDVSLVTGKIRHTVLLSEDNTEDTSDTALAVRDKMELSAIHSQGAGEFLQNRSWKGLEQKLGETPSAEIQEGQHGIASAYDGEIHLQDDAN